jgi:radical SAM protein with 4Fe4S-binding SPASM domain
MVVDRFGYVYPCVRFNPHKFGKLGDANKTPLIDIWNGEERKQLVNNLVRQRRDLNEICKKTNCAFWGVPTGYD